MNDPVPFISAVEKARLEADEALIGLLERSLDQARRGELAAILLIRIDQAGNFNQILEGDMKISSAIGFLEIAKHDLLQRERERPAVEDEPSA